MSGQPIRIRPSSGVNHIQFSRRLMDVPVEYGLPSVDVLWKELQEYMDILLGRVNPPISSPYLALAECATAYHSRALEIEAQIHAGEREGAIMKGSPLYQFRTGELRSFIALSKKAAELGSRRLTQEQLLAEERYEE